MLIAFGCGGEGDGDAAPAPSCEDRGVTIEQTDMPTVLRVSWATDEARDQVAWWSEDGGAPRPTAPSSGTDHEVLVAGAHATTEVAVRVADLGEEPAGDPCIGETGALSSALPSLEQTGKTALAEPGFTWTTVISTNGTWPVAIAQDGGIVWAHEQVEAIRTYPSIDGEAVLFNDAAHSVDEAANIYRMALDGSSQTQVEVFGGHTDFVEVSDGVYAVLAWDIQEDAQGNRLLGDMLVEIDESGASRVVWNAFDWLETGGTEDYGAQGTYLPDPEVYDWTHANGLAYDAATDAYFLSIGNLDAVVRVDRADGNMAWVLGGELGEFAGGESLIVFPHSVQYLDGSVLVFNRVAVGADSCSSASEIALDLESYTAAETWRYESEECLLITVLGGALRLEGGNTLVSWSPAGQMDEVTADGALAWRVATAFGAAFGFATRETLIGVDEDAE